MTRHISEASSSGIVKLSGARREKACPGISGHARFDDFCPCLIRPGAKNVQGVSGAEMRLDIEEIVDGCVSVERTLS